MNVCVKLFLSVFCLLFPAVVQGSATTQRLLDELERVHSMEKANPIVEKLWKEWTTAHNNEDEKALMNAGIDAMSSGNLDRAENLFTKLIEANPSFTEAWNKRATIRFMLWDFEGSLRDVEKVLALEPRHFGALSGLGMIHLRLGAPESALKAYEDLLSVFPSNVDAIQKIITLKDYLGVNTL
jgi:tetratricopeptide (TPR) repeat protein